MFRFVSRSDFNTLTFAVVFLVLSLAAIGVMLAPESFEYYVNYIHSLELPRALLVFAKALFAWPFMYHLCNGIRHLVCKTYSIPVIAKHQHLNYTNI